MKIAKIKNSKDSELSLVIENGEKYFCYGKDKIENYLKGAFEC